MKKFIAISFCFVLAVSALTGCRRNNKQKTTDTTVPPSTMTTTPTTHATAPTTHATEPSTGTTIPSTHESEPSGESMPTENTTDGMDGENARSRVHHPSTVGKGR